MLPSSHVGSCYRYSAFSFYKANDLSQLPLHPWMLNESARFERFTVFKPPALQEVFDLNPRQQGRANTLNCMTKLDSPFSGSLWVIRYEISPMRNINSFATFPNTYSTDWQKPVDHSD
jgi:hypothetical protein